jgi:hypothetical protein
VRSQQTLELQRHGGKLPREFGHIDVTTEVAYRGGDNTDGHDLSTAKLVPCTACMLNRGSADEPLVYRLFPVSLRYSIHHIDSLEEPCNSVQHPRFKTGLITQPNTVSLIY